MADDRLYIMTTSAVPLGGLKIETVTVTGTPYTDCTNKDESLLSLLKRCIVSVGGRYVLQINRL